jgi:uncharacterized protein (TIGR02117 family)
MRRLLRLLIILVCLVPIALLIYTLAAFGLSVATSRAPLPTEGTLIFACDNGVHTDLVMPVNSGGIDWRTLFPQQHFIAPIDERGFVNVGWGSRDFYLNTPTWADVEFGRVMKALAWDETVIRVDYRHELTGESCALWRVDVESYRRIAAFVTESLRLSQGQAVKTAAGYGDHDAFFIANELYSPIETCNQWTGQALRAGGAPVAPWTPFSFLVLWNLPTNSVMFSM